MLAYLTVRNFALVADLELRFGEGLTVITGESGAGKSILLDALGLVLGERASKTQIRPDANNCEVNAEFDLSQAAATRDLLASQELLDESDPTRCVVRRIASKDGRSRAWVNDSPVSLGVLRDLCGTLVAIHGQFAQQQLFGATSQLAWFDDFVAEPDLVQQVKSQYREWQTSQTRYEEERLRVQNSSEHRELLEYQVEELDAFQLEENEFEDLTVRFKRLNQKQTFLTTVGEAIQRLEDQLVAGLDQTRTHVSQVEDEAKDLLSAAELLDTATVSSEEALSHLRAYHELLSSEDDSFEIVSERLDQIHELARKHRVQSSELHRKSQEIRLELNSLAERSNRLSEFQANTEKAEAAFVKAAKQLSQKRKQAAKPFAEAVMSTLASLGMKKAKFNVSLVSQTSANGFEQVDFAVSPNSRYEPGPLKAIASGGELSRISLAILVVVASHSNLPCLILDEADIGVGGTTADEIGRMLKRLADYTQVVCVTHAPQVAALGNAHLCVTKDNVQDVAAQELLGDARVEEIARMVAGHEVNADARQFASVLLREAQQQVPTSP